MAKQRTARTTLWLGAMLVASAGCPADLADPERFLAKDQSSCTAKIDVPALLAKRCGTADCHEKNKSAGELDLVSKGIAKRLLNRPASECHGKTLVDTKNPSKSYFFEKLERSRPTCGSIMPQSGAPITAAEIACIRAWLGVGGEPASGDGGAAVDAGAAAVDSSPAADSTGSSADSSGD